MKLISASCCSGSISAHCGRSAARLYRHIALDRHNCAPFKRNEKWCKQGAQASGIGLVEIQREREISNCYCLENGERSTERRTQRESGTRDGRGNEEAIRKNVYVILLNDKKSVAAVLERVTLASAQIVNCLHTHTSPHLAQQTEKRNK